MDITSRLPDPAQFFPELGGWAASLTKAIHNETIPASTIGLVHLRVGQIVGSTYHTVRQSDLLRKAGETEERITAVASWRDAPYFSAAERVALELAEAVCTPNPAGERVPDDLYERAAAHYDERALWTLTLVIAQILFFVPVAAIAKPIPGMPFGKNYRP